MTEVTTTTTDPYARLKGLPIPDAAAVERSVAVARRAVDSIEIKSQEDMDLAAELLASIKNRWNDTEAQRTTITVPLNASLSATNAIFQPKLKALEAVELDLKNKMIAWTTAEAHRVALAKVAAEKLAEEQRQAAAAVAAAATKKANEDAAELQRQAAEAQAAGDVDKVIELENQASDVVQAGALEAFAAETVAATIVAQPLANAPRRTAGFSVSKTWDYEITDPVAAVNAALQNPDLAAMLIFDNIKLKNYVKAMGSRASIPGIRVFEKGTGRMKV